MKLLSAALLPVRRLGAGIDAAATVSDLAAPSGPLRRPGGYGTRIAALLGEGGSIDQLARLASEDGPLSRIEQLALLTGDDQPLGRALARGGPRRRQVPSGRRPNVARAPRPCRAC